MNPVALEFLAKHNVSALTILLPDGTPHAAAVHFSHKSEPFTLFFSTHNTSRKATGLLNGESQKAAVVVGLSEEEWITFQAEGTISVITDSQQLAEAKTTHYAKNPGSKKFEGDPKAVFLCFTPTWWRYTDFNTKPMTVISSE